VGARVAILLSLWAMGFRSGAGNARFRGRKRGEPNEGGECDGEP